MISTKPLYRTYIDIDLPYHIAIRSCNLAHNLLGVNAGALVHDHENDVWRIVIESPKKLSACTLSNIKIMLATMKAVIPF